MIIAKSNKGKTEVLISGDSQTVLNELLTTVSQVLKAFDSQGYADVVMEGIVDVTEQFMASITNTNNNSKGEEND